MSAPVINSAPPTTEVVEVQLSLASRLTVAGFIALPLIALVAAIPVAITYGLTWLNLTLALVFYAVASVGITVGYHRLFTHRSFKANRPTTIALGIAGSMAIEGSMATWVADHRRHHKYSDEVGDPHSPWKYGTSPTAIAKGLGWAHCGWLFSGEKTRVERFAPDILKDRDTGWVHRWFPAFLITSLVAPAVLGGLLTWSWAGAITAFFWAGLVRIALVHHVTWSINSVCHVWGKRPFRSRDNSGNVAWLALPSLGESWHNYHHADPTSARHGVLPKQVDATAAMIRGMEKVGWASSAKWPSQERINKRLLDPEPTTVQG